MTVMQDDLHSANAALRAVLTTLLWNGLHDGECEELLVTVATDTGRYTQVQCAKHHAALERARDNARRVLAGDYPRVQ